MAVGRPYCDADIMLASAPFPFADAPLASSWLAGLLVVVLGPGFAIVGRHLKGTDPVSRFGFSFAAGVLFATLCSHLLTVLSIPISWWANAISAALTAALISRFGRVKSSLARLATTLPPLSKWESTALVVLVMVLARVLVQELGTYCVPVSLYDATNHSYLTHRIFETRSVAAADIFPEEYSPAVPYLVGAHAAAALISDCCHVAPYVSMWYLTTAIAALYPIMLSILWRILGFGRSAIVLGCLLATCNFHVPISLYDWGGYGAIIGMGLLPWLVAALAALATQPSISLAIVAGLSCIAMIHIHATELFVGFLFLWPAFSRATGRTWRIRLRTSPAIVFLAMVLVLGLLPLTVYMSPYHGLVNDMSQARESNLYRVWKSLGWYLGGGVVSMQVLAFCGLLSGVVLPRFRRVGLLALGVAVTYVVLTAVQDPFTRALTRPFYSQAARVLFLATLLLPPLVGDGLSAGVARLVPRKSVTAHRMAWSLLTAAMIWWCVLPGMKICRISLSANHLKSPFTAADWELARRMGELEPRQAVSANLEADGSFWVMYISGRQLLDPCGWPLGPKGGPPWRDVIPCLVNSECVSSTERMSDLGVQYLVVSSTDDGWSKPGFTADALAADSRFERVLTNGGTSVYRIHWP
jgi:hypothetical protein